jgi:hypothetical protein
MVVRGHTEAALPLVHVEPMHIEVIDKDESSNAQARAYAEYRLFAALARHARRVRGARLVLRRVERNGACDAVVCAVTVTLEPSGYGRTRGSGPHAYAAINRAVERMGDLMRRRNHL